MDTLKPAPPLDSAMPVWTIGEMIRAFGEVATVDPLSTVLFVLGNLILLFSVGLFGVLTLGAIASLLRPR